MSPSTLEYTPSPTLAAIDRAAARAYESVREAEKRQDQPAETPDPPSAAARVAKRVVGDGDSYERGFLIAAVTIAGLLLLGRLIVPAGPLVGVLAPAIVLLLAVLQKTDARIDAAAGPRWLVRVVRSRLLRPALALVAAPALTAAAPNLFAAVGRAIVWTSWGAMLIGAAAILFEFAAF